MGDKLGGVLLAAWLVGGLGTGCDGNGGPDADADADVDGVDADPDADSDLECDLIGGAGCGPNEKCSLYSQDGESWRAGCVPLLAADRVAAGEICHAIADAWFGAFDNCPGGYVCLRRPGTEQFVCDKLCTTANAGACTDAYLDPTGEPTVSGVCVYALGDDMPLEGLMACSLAGACDPRCQDCEGTGVGCYAATDGVNAGRVCASVLPETADGGGAGSPCGYLNGCAPGHHCQARTCRAYCAFDGVDAGPGCAFTTCGTGTSCDDPESDGGPFGQDAGLGLCL